jgi:Clostripain family
VSDKQWLVMLYVASDDKVDALDKSGTLTNECGAMLGKLANAAANGSIDLKSMTVVALIDSPFDAEEAAEKDKGKNDDEKTYTYMIPGVKELGEDGWSEIDSELEPKRIFYNVRGKKKINSGSYKTLANFIQWARYTYPAENTMLAIVGHGGGWSPGFPQVESNLFPSNTFFKKGHLAFRVGSDQQQADSLPHGDPKWQVKKGGNVSPAIEGLCPDYSPATDNILHVAISTRGLGVALEEATEGQQKKLDVLFLDACLMSMVEVAYEIKDYVDYLVAGEDLLYARFPYDLYLQDIQSQTPQQLATSIVQLYNTGDPRLVQKSWEIAATNLAKVSDLRDAINSMAGSLLEAIELSEKVKPRKDVKEAIFEAYDRSQKFDYDGDLDVDKRTEGYVDLFDFAEQLSMSLAGSTLHGNNADLRASIATAREYAKTIKQIIGESFQAVQPTNANLVSVLETIGSSNNAVLGSRAQTDKEGKRILDRAHGLSIYLPLGEPDGRSKTDPADADEGDLALAALFQNRTYLDFYGEQLKFTNQNGDFNANNCDFTSWAKLVRQLAAARFASDDQSRSLTLPSYYTPRQILPEYVAE